MLEYRAQLQVLHQFEKYSLQDNTEAGAQYVSTFYAGRIRRVQNELFSLYL